MDNVLGSGKSGRWHPAPAVRASLWLHAGGAIAIAAQPACWPWVAGGLATNHLLLSVAVLFPRGSVVGANLLRLPAAAAQRGEICLTFDDGPDPVVTPRVLDLLDRHGSRASFFCIGQRAAMYPDLVREIVRRGHSVENHSQHHAHMFSFYGLSKLAREVDLTQEVIAGITGQAPQFFRAPAGFRSVLLDPVLTRRGLRYVSWTRRGYDAVCRDSTRVLERLLTGLTAGDILLLHDVARADQGAPPVLVVLPTLLEAMAKQGLHSVSLPSALFNESPA